MWVRADTWVRAAPWAADLDVTITARFGVRSYRARLISSTGVPVSSQTITRESTALVGPIVAELTVDAVTEPLGAASFSLAITPRHTRPTEWATPTVVGGKPYVLVSNLAPGAYDVWLRYTGNPEVMVLPVGVVIVT